MEERYEFSEAALARVLGVPVKDVQKHRPEFFHEGPLGTGDVLYSEKGLRKTAAAVAAEKPDMDFSLFAGLAEKTRVKKAEPVSIARDSCFEDLEEEAKREYALREAAMPAGGVEREAEMAENDAQEATGVTIDEDERPEDGLVDIEACGGAESKVEGEGTEIEEQPVGDEMMANVYFQIASRAIGVEETMRQAQTLLDGEDEDEEKKQGRKEDGVEELTVMRLYTNKHIIGALHGDEIVRVRVQDKKKCMRGGKIRAKHVKNDLWQQI